MQEYYDYIIGGYIAPRFHGNREKLKTWKKKVKNFSFEAKNKNEPLSFQNSVMKKIRKNKTVICVKKSELASYWKKFHVDMGHGGNFCFSRNFYFGIKTESF